MNGTRIFRAGAHMLTVTGAFAGLLIALGVAVGFKNGDWSMLEAPLIASAIVFALQAILRLEIGPAGIKYRNLTGSRSIEFENIKRAYVEVVRPSKSPQGIATFWLELHGGKRVKINLRTFSIQAAALLFSALDARGLPIEAPDEWAAGRLMNQVRAAQAKLGD
jgi:hypothetical protein